MFITAVCLLFLLRSFNTAAVSLPTTNKHNFSAQLNLTKYRDICRMWWPCFMPTKKLPNHKLMHTKSFWFRFLLLQRASRVQLPLTKKTHAKGGVLGCVKSKTWYNRSLRAQERWEWKKWKWQGYAFYEVGNREQGKGLAQTTECKNSRTRTLIM